MNWLDYLMLVPVVWLLILGFSKGFAREITSFVALYLAIFIGFKGMYALTHWFAREFELTKPWLPFLCFMLLFVGVFLLFLFSGKLLDKLFKAVALGWLNRLAGALFGALKGLMLISVLYWLVNQVNLIDPLDKQASLFFPYVNTFSVGMFDWLGRITPVLGDLFGNMESLFEELSTTEI